MKQAQFQNLPTTIALPKKPRPVCIIGAGGIVHDCHLPAYKRAGFQVHGIFDIQNEKAQALAGRFQISNVFQSLEEMAEHSPDDAIFDLAVPANAISNVIEKLPDHSSVLIQKPLGETLVKAREIVALCNQKKIKAGVNFQLRYAPSITAARNFIEQGFLGKLHDIEVRVNVFTPWHLWNFLFDLPRMEILYHSIHYLDLVRSFLGNPGGVYARTVKDPNSKNLTSTKSSIILDYGELIRAVISTNHSHQFGPEKQESFVKFEGTKGAIKIVMGVNLNYPEGVPDTFEYCIPENEKDPEWKKLNVGGSWFPDAFKGSMGGFQSYLEGSSTEFTSTISDALQTMALVEAAYESDSLGGVEPDFS